MFSSALYRSSPLWLQEQLVSLRGRFRKAIREGSRFRQVCNEIAETQWYAGDRLRVLQWERVRALVAHAAEHVPYYRSLFEKHGVRIESLKSLEDMSSIPLLEKADVQRLHAMLLADNIGGVRIKATTSGSTGTPLILFSNLEAVIRENAFVWRQLAWSGYRRREPRAWLRGDMVVPVENRKPPYWRRNTADNMLMLSSYHLSEGNAQTYIEILNDFDPVLVQAYPSAIAFLARFLESHGRKYAGRRLRSVVTTSETLTETDVKTIEERFGCRVYEQYGSAERVTMIHTCEHGRRHIDSDYGFTELLPAGSGLHEIVGTGFNNWLMPLIRYRTGDTLELADPNEECPCGRQFPLVKKIHGRMDDYLKTPDGRLIGRIDHIFKGAQHIAEAQLLQDSLDEVVIHVVPFGNFGAEDRAMLTANAQHRLGKQMRVRVELVSAIPRTQSGKFRAVICNV